MKYINTFNLLPFCMVILVVFIASSGGRDDNRAGAPGDIGTCATCHGSFGSTATISLTGAPTTYLAGVTYPLTLSISETNANQLAAGFQIVASNGSTGVNQGSFTPSSGTRISATNRLVQSSPLAYVNNAASWTFDWTAPTIGQEEIIFYYTVNSVNLNGGTSGDFVYLSTTSISLPVEWAYISVNKSIDGDVLTWGTKQEINNSHFEVEISKDARSFDKLAEIQVNQAFSFGKDYSLPLDNVSFGKHYIRVKQVDFDGKYDYSDIVVYERNQDNIILYPTSVDSYLHVDGECESCIISIFNLQGNLVLNSILDNSIDLSNLISGRYFVHLSNTNNQLIHSETIIKI